jgi:hypothetical protein
VFYNVELMKKLLKKQFFVRPYDSNSRIRLIGD